MQDESQLEYYATPGPMTDLTRCPPEMFERLPDAPNELVTVARRCITASLPAPADRHDPQIRPADEMVQRIRELDPSPIVERRSWENQFLGNCRHFATLSCALFRLKGVPARVRAGFASYFIPDTWMDHWILEYWRPSEERWVRVDPQYGDKWASARHPGATSELLAQTMFSSGGEIWRRCRRGEIDPNRCNMGGVNWGIGEVRGSVLFDLAALNKVEVLPWDTWGHMKEAYKSETGTAYDELLDLVSATIIEDDLGATNAIYATSQDLQVPRSLLPASSS